jgi:D-sedoheptulose 7-phosphate isomerase
MIKFKKAIIESINIKNKLKKEGNKVELIQNILLECLLNKKKILICGNGGSAADADHLATEFIVRLRPKINREALKIFSLTFNTSAITATGNDFGFEKIFSRNLEAIGEVGDILIVLTTSGNSKNILEVLKLAKKMKIQSIGFLGGKGGKAKNLCDETIVIPSNNTARIQEEQKFLGHLILEKLEDMLLKKEIIKKF